MDGRWRKFLSMSFFLISFFFFISLSICHGLTRSHRLPIRAVVLGSAVNNDGAAKQSFPSTSQASQVAVIQKALKTANIR
jgi:hypothetical protein